GSPGRADAADGAAGLDDIAILHLERREVRVAVVDAIGVSHHDEVAVSAAFTGEYDRAAGRGRNLGPVGGPQVDAAVELGFARERVRPPAETRRDAVVERELDRRRSVGVVGGPTDRG